MTAGSGFASSMPPPGAGCWRAPCEASGKASWSWILCFVVVLRSCHRRHRDFGQVPYIHRADERLARCGKELVLLLDALPEVQQSLHVEVRRRNVHGQAGSSHRSFDCGMVAKKRPGEFTSACNWESFTRRPDTSSCASLTKAIC